MPISTKPAEALFQWPRWAFSFPDQTALSYASPDNQLIDLSWGDLVQAVDALCHRLIDLGLHPGDRIVHRCGNTIDGVFVALASAALGTIEVPLEPTIDHVKFQAVIDQVGGRELGDEVCRDLFRNQTDPSAGSSAVCCAQSLVNRQSRHADDSPSLILMTSGTSGRSKAVTLSRRNLSTNAMAKLAAVPQTSDDLRLTLLPICHAYARTCDLGTWLLSGSRLAISSGWDGWQRLAAQVRPTLVNTVPSIAMRMLDLPPTSPETSRLRLVGCGGAALPADAFERFRWRGITVIQGYGMTETSPVICSATPENARAGFVGTPVAGWQTRVDAEGRLSVRGEGVMVGYWGDAASTAQRCSDGWIDTGDIVEVDPTDGQFRILGRADDRITLSNGRKLYPLPIEQRVMLVPQVRHAILVADDRHTELWIDIEGCDDPDSYKILDASGIDSWGNRIARELYDLPTWQLPRRVYMMPTALADMPGMLTAKGTPVRSRVIAQIMKWRNDPTIVAQSIDAAGQ
jgi:long-chain acyl-CoA synthetase